MKHLITGGSGFLGVSLARLIAASGESSRVYDLAHSSLLPKGVEFVQGDIRDRERLFEAARGIDVVHHLVGLMPQSRAPEDLMQAVNVEGTRNALDAATAAGVKRFVFLSSMEAYGYPERAPFDETCALRPLNVYGRNKVEAEALCVRYWKEKGLETVSLRPSTLVGPGITEPTFQMTLKLLSNPPALIPLPAGGKTFFQMTEVSDCAELCLVSSRAAGIAGEAFNAGAEGTLCMRDQVIALMRRLGKKTPRILPVPAGLAKALLLLGYHLGISKLEPDHISLLDTDMVMDCGKAARLLGWRPRKTNIDMIIETFEAYLKEKSQ